MKQYFVDFTGVKTIWGLHEALKKGLAFPSYYGMNMDALWDCLTSDIDDPCELHISGLNSIPADLYDETSIMLKIFKRTEKWYADLNLCVRFVFED